MTLSDFYKLDKKLYILDNNDDFLNWYLIMRKKGFKSIIDINSMQRLIKEITEFYEFKYSNQMFMQIENNKLDEIQEEITFSKKLNFNELKKRLWNNYIDFLDCSYEDVIELKRNKDHLYDIESIFIRIKPSGNISDKDIRRLNAYGFIDDLTIDNVEQLSKSFLEDKQIDYDDVKALIMWHKYCVSLRNRVLKVIPFSLIYSKTTNPRYGYIRAKSYIRAFKKEYNIEFDEHQLDKIMADLI